MVSDFPPWLLDRLEAVDLRRTDRVLLCLPGSAAVASAIRGRLNRDCLTVLESNRASAQEIHRSLSDLDLGYGDVSPEQSLGIYDVVIAAPIAPPPRSTEVWTHFVARHLRPGGRYVLDLPSPDPMPDVLAAARDANLPCAETIHRRFCGPAPEELAVAMRNSRVRKAETLLGTHLVRFDSPFDVAQELCALLRLPEDDATQLGEAIARRCQSTTTIELRVMRSAVTGMR